MSKIGLLGGSFDPVHKAHIDIALNAIEQLQLDELRLIPTKNNPWKDHTSSSNEDRIQMLDIAISHYDKIKIERCEIDNLSNEKNYTYLTLDYLMKDSHDEFYYIMGMDQANLFYNWKECDYISKKVKLVAFHRGGYNPDDEVLNHYGFIKLNNVPIDSSSSEIRNGRVDLLDPKVLSYISKHGLYLDTIISSKMKEKRRLHSISVANLAKKIAQSNGLDVNKTYIAAIMHDIAKEMDYEQSYQIMKSFYNEYIDKPVSVWHQWISAYVCKNEFLIHDQEILDAIMWHTTAHIPMSPIAKCIYAADKLDPLRDYDSSLQIELCLNNIHDGFKQCLAESYEYLSKKNVVIDDDFKEIYEYYVIKGEI